MRIRRRQVLGVRGGRRASHCRPLRRPDPDPDPDPTPLRTRSLSRWCLLRQVWAWDPASRVGKARALKRTRVASGFAMVPYVKTSKNL